MLISCLCITRNRREWLPSMLQCFQAQTWEEKELIVVADSVSDISGWSPNDERVTIYVPKKPERWTIGEKRNVACSVAKGELLANLDDDDHSGPLRLEYQADALLKARKSVCVLRDIPFTDGTKWWLNRNWPGGYGSTHLFRRDWWEKNPYPQINSGEDWEVVSHAMRKKELVAVKALNHFYAVNHPGNTATRVIGEGWEFIERAA